MSVEWIISDQPVAYDDALKRMEARVAAIREQGADEAIWLLEHPPLYTAGTSAKAGDLLATERFPVYATGRGGQVTYHGPGQRIAYVMLDLAQRGRDIRQFVAGLEQVAISTLAVFGIKGEIRPGRVGVWVTHEDGREEKIAAIGVRVRRWVSYHGLSININPDLSHYQGIIPCGLPEYGITSLKALGQAPARDSFDRALKGSFERVFGLS